MRLSIDITPEQHRVLKAAAALEGQSIKSYVLGRVLPERAAEDQTALANLEAELERRLVLGRVLPERAAEDQTALANLEAELERRLATADRGEIATKSVGEIFDDTLAEVEKSG